MKYLYIDDEYKPGSSDNVQAVADRLMLTDKIHVDLHAINSFEELTIELGILLKNYDGLILDLQLNDRPNEKNIRFPSNAPTLAQHIRNESTDRKIKHLPIILCSTNNKIKRLYTKDLTSHDLFDMSFVKEIMQGDDKEKDIEWNSIIDRLYSLAEGYKLLEEYKGNLGQIWGIDIKDLDSRMFSRLAENNIPIHEYARYILKEFIYTTGPLVTEELLAARLGIDMANSEDWDKLINKHFIDAKYNGVFSSGWKRWWMHLIDQLFETLTKQPLQFINARERVNLLSGFSGLKKLKNSELIPKCKSYRYWTLCKGTKMPMDPREGFKINPIIEPNPWQEYEYISLYAMLERIGFDSDNQTLIHLSDRERYLAEKNAIKK